MTPIQPTKRYDTTFFVADRWREVALRPDDIVVATPYKAGTTWTQNIVLHLIFQDLQLRNIGDFSPWLEMRFTDFDDIRQRLDRQANRRVIKSHIAFDGLLFYPELKYIFVARDPRDIFMSLWNFYINFGDDMFEPLGLAGVPDLPRPPATIQDCWDDWISRGAIEGEGDGYPFWSCFHQMRTWWDQRRRPNILFVHYNDLLADLHGQIARIARFLDIPVAPDKLEAITGLCQFAAMRRDAATLDRSAEETLKGGAKTFFNKGKNGRWRGVLDDARLAEYERVAAAVMGAECKGWMEAGGGALGLGQPAAAA